MAVVTMLSPEKQARLMRLRNRPTAYELALIAPDGRRWLVIYVHRANGRSLRSVIYPDDVTGNCALNICAAFVIANAPRNTWTFADDWKSLTAANGWRIAFTGRTKYQATMEDELTFVRS
jgi:hypothetical protein